MSDTFPTGDAETDKAQADHDMTDAADEEVIAEDEKSEEAAQAQVDKDIEQLKQDENSGPTPSPSPTPAPTPQPDTGHTLYEFVGGDPATIDITNYALSHTTDDEGNALYTYAGDVNPDDENGTSEDWEVYTGSTQVLSVTEQAERGVGTTHTGPVNPG